MRTPTPEELEKLRITTKGCNRKLLAEWGIPWPPPSGWRRKLIGQRSKELTLSERMNGFVTVRDFLKIRQEVLKEYQNWRNESCLARPAGTPDTPWPDSLKGIIEEEVLSFR